MRASVTSETVAGNESGGRGEGWYKKQIVLKKKMALEHIDAAFETTVGPLVGNTPLVFCIDSNCRGRGPRSPSREEGERTRRCASTT